MDDRTRRDYEQEPFRRVRRPSIVTMGEVEYTEERAAYEALAPERAEIAGCCSRARLRQLLPKLASVVYAWSVVGPGFFNARVGARSSGTTTHIHVWDRSIAWATQFPHSHPFPLRSMVLTGAVTNRVFINSVDAPEEYSSAHMRYVNGKWERSWGSSFLVERSASRITAELGYFVDENVVHVADAEDGTVTLVEKGPTLRSAHIHVPRSIGDEEREVAVDHFIDYRKPTPSDLDRIRELLSAV